MGVGGGVAIVCVLQLLLHYLTSSSKVELFEYICRLLLLFLLFSQKAHSLFSFRSTGCVWVFEMEVQKFLETIHTVSFKF